MRFEFRNKLSAYTGLRSYLRQEESLPIWLNREPEAFTTLEQQFETGAADLGAFGEEQSRTLEGETDQQNLAETSLEEAAHPLSRALRLYYKGTGNLADAEIWNLSATDWERLQERLLLDKARALHTAILPFTVGNPPPGQPQGLSAAKAEHLLNLIEDYEEEVGKPRGVRSGRKAKTAALRPRFRSVDETLDDMDDLAPQFRGTPASDLFVEGYFNARRIGGRSPDRDDAPPQNPSIGLADPQGSLP